MTNQELNRDIKRLVKRYKELINKTSTGKVKFFGDTYYTEEELVIKEWRRLFYADQDFQVMTKQNILYMLKLNLRLNCIPHHRFGTKIKLDK